MNWRIQVFCLFVLSSSKLIDANEHNHIYEDNEDVNLWMSTINPYYNRQETYFYFMLPFCPGLKESITHYKTLTETLQGVDLQYSGINIEFKVPVLKTFYCGIKLTENRMKSFVYAIENQYWYEMYLDKLPMWGVVGEIEKNNNKTSYYLFTHKKFDIEYNGAQIVDINFISDEIKVKLIPNIDITFSYEINWIESDKKFENKYKKYLDPYFFLSRIHWYSLFSSYMMVVLFFGIVLTILLHTLKKKHLRFNKNQQVDNIKKGQDDKFNWGDDQENNLYPVSYPILFSALIGIGTQIAMVILIVIIYAVFDELRTERGHMLTLAIFFYALTCPLNGFTGSVLYAKMGGRLWINQMLLSAFILPVLVWGTTLSVSFIAMLYHSTRAIPFEAMISWTCLCLFIPLLTSIGSILGKNRAASTVAPCRNILEPKPKLKEKWFLNPLFIIPLGGILPFGSIFIELFFIFTSFWAYKIYMGYELMLLAFIFLIGMVIGVTIICTLLLKSKNHRWQWTSFLAAASTGGYAWIYSFYYYFFRTRIYGFFQTVFFFSYMTLFSLALGVMCGAVGYLGASAFIQKIHSVIKVKNHRSNMEHLLTNESKNSLPPSYQKFQISVTNGHNYSHGNTELPQVHSLTNSTPTDIFHIKI